MVIKAFLVSKLVRLMGKFNQLACLFQCLIFSFLKFLLFSKNFRPDWKKERLTNQETFGHFAVRSLEYRRGRNGYRLTRNRFVRPRFCNNNATLSGGGFGQARSGNNTDSNTGMTNISFGTIGRRFPPFSRKRSTSRITRKSLSAVSTIKN